MSERRRRCPRGRHGLSREAVERSQRERLLDAAAQVTAARGYEATTVADILAEAGVGRETFYELFEDRRACVLAAHRELLDDLVAHVRVAYEGPGEWVERCRATLRALLDWFAADPALAASCWSSRPRSDRSSTRSSRRASTASSR